jgi:hypothetical protein
LPDSAAIAKEVVDVLIVDLLGQSRKDASHSNRRFKENRPTGKSYLF